MDIKRLLPRAGPDSKDSGGRRASRAPCGVLLHDAPPRGSRHYAPGHVRPDVPAGLRTCGRGSAWSAYLFSLPGHRGPVRV